MLEDASAGEPAFHAELYEWSYVRIGEDAVAVGRVRRDKKKRWPDGHAIITSAVVSGEMAVGKIIQTRNTRYLLSGPRGEPDDLLHKGRRMEANVERRQRFASENRLFDLLPAAWGLEDEVFERLADLPPHWMSEWRDHHRSPLDEELAIARRLAAFHDVLRAVSAGVGSYARWWRQPWPAKSLIGGRAPLQAVIEDGESALLLLEAHLRTAK